MTQRPSTFWTVVTVMLSLVLLDAISTWLAVAVAAVLVVVLLSRAFARTAARELGRRRP